MPAPQAQPAPPAQPPTPPPSPFPNLPTLSEISVAQAIVKRLRSLIFDPRFAQQPVEWQSCVIDVYNAARQAQIPPPPPPKVDIRGMATDAPTLEAEESGAMAGWKTQAPPANPGAGPNRPAQGPNAPQVAAKAPQITAIPKMPA